MPSIMESLKHNLPILRKAKGFSQDSLAAAVGTVRGTIANYERGYGGASVVMLSKLAETLGVEETDLVKPPGPTLDEYKHFFDITAENDRLKKEIAELKQQIQSSDPVIREIVAKLSTFDQFQKERALFQVNVIKDRGLQQSVVPKEKKLK